VAHFFEPTATFAANTVQTGRFRCAGRSGCSAARVRVRGIRSAQQAVVRGVIAGPRQTKATRHWSWDLNVVIIA
jgi:hypothetical protein